MFWDAQENLVDKQFYGLINLLKNNKILFNCPIAAAKRLEEVSNKNNYNWWYKSKEIQNLRKKILKMFFYTEKEPVKIWNKKLAMFFMKKNKEIELHNLKYEELKNLNQNLYSNLG